MAASEHFGLFGVNPYMKTAPPKVNTTLVLALFLLPVALAVSAAEPKSPVPYEIVLEMDKIVFEKAETVSSPILIRDLGVQKMVAPELYWGLSVVWDGKEYKRDPKQVGRWNGPWEIIPKTAWRAAFSLSEFLVPAEAWTGVRHTIALKDTSAESNTLTVFIEKAK